jgi:L-lactate dehydrogenase complex protein LldG
MTESLQHRNAILGSIRRSLGNPKSSVEIASEYAVIPRTYRQKGALEKSALLDFFEDRLREYDADVYRSSPSEIGEMIGQILTRRGKQRLAIPAGLPPSWLPSGFAFEQATHVDANRLNGMDGVVSGCTVAIAETGTIVLQNALAQGPRLLSLVPDYQLCIVLSHQIVEQVPEAFVRLRDTSNLPTTFISGPSATADIEMTRIKGVHGPRFLDVLIVA